MGFQPPLIMAPITGSKESASRTCFQSQPRASLSVNQCWEFGGFRCVCSLLHRESELHEVKSQLEFTFNVIVQELCESRGGRPGLSVLTSLPVSVDVKQY